MIYANAETAQDIASLLRLKDSEENLVAKKVADRLLGKTTIKGEGKGIIITAPRQSGKSTELLKYAEERNPFGNFAVVCLNQETQKYIVNLHWKLFNNIGPSDIVAARLLGKPVKGDAVSPPLMVSPSTIHLLRGRGLPIYVDELGAISNDRMMDSLLATGLFMAAVTS